MYRDALNFLYKELEIVERQSLLDQSAETQSTRIADRDDYFKEGGSVLSVLAGLESNVGVPSGRDRVVTG